jgi:Tfp pilus assembly protein PilF
LNTTDPKSIYRKLALIFFQTGNWSKAIVEYEKLITFDPNDYNLHSILGDLFRKVGNFDRAYQEYEIAAKGFKAERNERKASVVYRELTTLIRDHIEPQDSHRAIELYNQILSEMPETVEALENLRNLKYQNGENQEALQLTIHLGNLYNKLDYIDKAKAEFLKALQMDPQNEEANQKLTALINEMEKLK